MGMGWETHTHTRTHTHTPTDKENMESDFYCSSTESEWAQLWSKMATIYNNADSWKRVHSVYFNTAKIIEVK